jgi:nucleoside-diphosphate-sugar epimerase
VKVAVTGAGGFLGTHVLAELVARPGVEVVAMTRSARPLPASVAQVRQVTLDIANADNGVFDVLGRPDVVIHLAWSSLSNYRSVSHFEEQLPQQYRFLKNLVSEGLATLLCTGTCLEYGMQSGELTEEMRTDPRLPYPFAKDSLRRQLEFLRGGKEFALTWARLFYVWGPGQARSSLYSQLTAAIRAGERTFRMSAGEQLRDYLPAADMARYLVRLAIEVPDSGPVNVCSGRPVAVRSLVERWVREAGADMTLELGQFPYPDYEPLAFWGSVKRLHELIAS